VLILEQDRLVNFRSVSSSNRAQDLIGETGKEVSAKNFSVLIVTVRSSRD